MSEETQMIVSQTKLFVGGLNRQMRGQDLREEFSKYGEVIFARVNLDRETKKSKGFGFVEFANPDDAARAKAELDGLEVWGRAIKVDFAKEDPTKMFHKSEEHTTAAPAEKVEEDAVTDTTEDNETEVDETAF
ncbi:MAG: RNA-binding protein [Candidatus Peribacteria bacterium]|jgi:RNA recognition motif-containing protein|nr:RNA-binding protein [Candidatus Peribacteria bacterium]